MLEDARAVAVIPVHDLDKARTFYEKMLGLRPAESMETGQELMYSVGETKLLVYRTHEELGGATKVTLIVDDLDKEMTDLRDHGITFEDFDIGDFKTSNGVAEDEHGRSAWFKDLEGNWIAMTQMKS
jgi:catechol 2,3-dioxygenase-like lactoylglutathione lyase family enzyme